jgi:hypothetical protein
MQYANRLLSPNVMRNLSGLLPETLAFRAAVVAAGGTLTTSQQYIVDQTLVRPLLNTGLWNSMVALYPFIGGSAAAHSINLITPGSFSVTWSGAVTHDLNGITGDGVTGYGNTGINVKTQIGDFAQLSVYNRTASIVNLQTFSGSLTNPGATAAFQIGNQSSSAGLFARQSTSIIHTLASGLTGFLSAASEGANSQYLRRYYRGSVTNSNTTTTTTAASTTPLLVLAVGVNVSGPAAAYTIANLAFLSVGPAQTQTKSDILAAIVEGYQSALGRLI